MTDSYGSTTQDAIATLDSDGAPQAGDGRW